MLNFRPRLRVNFSLTLILIYITQGIIYNENFKKDRKLIEYVLDINKYPSPMKLR